MTASTLAPFEADILDALLEAQRRLHSAPTPVAAPRHRVRRVAATVTVAAALGTTTAVLVATSSTTSSPTRPDAIGRDATEPIHAQTVAAITHRASAALTNLDGLVLHTRETRTRPTASGAVTDVYDTWSDRGDPEHSRAMYSVNGHPVYDIQTDSAAPSERFVDYGKHTWYEGPTIDYSNRHLLGTTPGRIRQQLDAGGLALVGHETIDGRDTLHLSRNDIAPLAGELWVDATTYLPVRSSNAIGTTDYEWLARTARSRSKLVPGVPPAFTFGGLPPETPANPDGSLG